jgi:hypothetical protein
MEYAQQNLHLKKFTAKPVNTVHLIIYFLQKYKILMKAMEKTKLEELVAVVLKHMENFKLLSTVSVIHVM